MSRPPFLTLPACARAYRLATSRGEFAVHEALPSGAPRGTALLVPGFTGSKEDFVALLEPLAAAGYRTVAVDGRGQHETEGPHAAAGAYERAELARDVRAQARALGGDVHLLGHSLGGLISRAAVLDDASAYRSLTLMSCGPAAISAPQQARTRMLVDALGTLDMDAVWQEMRRLDGKTAESAPAGPVDPELGAFLYRRWMATAPGQLMSTGTLLTTEPDRTAELAAVPLPKHVVSGVRDYAWPVPWIDAMAEELSAARTVIDGAEHSPNAERPAATAEALARFWDLS
ncbi:hydrolase [Streptomyces eurocidicus]|uniref:Hydrolase n=1 Tax=Streptomyces eurocidicus TaxID=66423 RepID=A0A2N8NRF2_STREU|nr:alpha/beta hydrolase [Streptomyces eurocidicus]MBB5117157.1 pimeloyl-ACP methyl ester carboxylesterase [Streptomyces eurocidicus]MBF6052550.1 alpha/beta fold hydrolase [Streptomyces eurocidicus]PNE31347.1 hydrolase [Streptomyces eurocidicus]